MIQIARASGTYNFPADFMLCAAMNPCPCGYYPDLNRCTCTAGEIIHYMGKINRPLLDRIDISTEDRRFLFHSFTVEEREKIPLLSEKEWKKYRRSKKNGIKMRK